MMAAPIRALLAAAALAVPALAFDPAGWAGYRSLTVSEPCGVARQAEPVDVAFAVPSSASLRLVHRAGSGWEEIPAQYYALHSGLAGSAEGRVAFLCSLPAGGVGVYRLYYGRAGAGRGDFGPDFNFEPAPPGPIAGPMHWIVENRYYRIETYPKNGQIWHIWDKSGADKMWWFKEWDGLEKGGDPVDWAPNVWVAYPDRVNPSPSNPKRGQQVFAEPFDWHYVVGWNQPRTEIISGPVFLQIRRWGPVPPHPEHTDFTYDRPAGPLVWASVTYRFYAGTPWYEQSSVLKTEADMSVYFIRNSQMVFRDSFFSHLAMRPQTPNLAPGDTDETCVVPLMAHYDRMPFFAQGHTLSNVLPSSFAYYSLFNPDDGDGYANFQLLERDSTLSGAPPTMLNHHMSLSEGHNWTVYFARTFNYTNQRYNPENVTFLPAGQRFEDRNIHLLYHYQGADSLRRLETWNAVFRHPLNAQWR